MSQRLVVLAFLGVASIMAVAGPATAQEVDAEAEADALLAEVVRARTLCATDPESLACKVADLRAVAIVANAVAEAGRTKDRAAFLDLARQFLTGGKPELRTSAVYALAKLGPDRNDTPVLRALLRDPISNVRTGAWTAASLSSDPAARAMARRVSERPTGEGYGPDPAAFDPAQLGFDLPPGAEYLWLTAASRENGQLQFLTAQPMDAVVAYFAGLGASPAMPIAEAWTARTEASSVLAEFLDPQIFGNAQVVTIGEATADLPVRFAVIYRDLVFDETGFAIVFADNRDLEPPLVSAPEVALVPESPLDATALDAAMLRRAEFKPEADPEESDLFMAIVAADGYGAEGYLELFPEGAYAVEARAYLAGPRLILDALTYREAGDVGVSFQNLPPGSSASVQIQSVTEDYAQVASGYIPDAIAGRTVIQTYGNLKPGVFLLVANVAPGDGSEDIVLRRDFSVELGLATLALDKAEYAPGEAIVVTFAGMSGDRQDYVSTALAGSANGAYLSYVYTEAKADGTAKLVAPGQAGAYEVRAFFREDESILRGSVPFTVTGAAVAPTAGEPSPDARATLTLDKSSYAPGETIAIAYSGMFGDRQDYVAISGAGSPNTSYLQYIYTQGSLAGSTTLVAPVTPGAYEVRAFFKEDETILRASVAFTVK